MILTADIPGERLDAFLARCVPDLSRSGAQKLLEEGHVTVNGQPVKKNHRPNPGDEICLTVPEPKEVDIVAKEIPLQIVYEDDDVMVINKPKGLVVHPAAGHQDDTLVNGLLFARPVSFPASTVSCAPASFTASIKIPPAFWPLPKMTLPIRCWPLS